MKVFISIQKHLYQSISHTLIFSGIFLLVLLQGCATYNAENNYQEGLKLFKNKEYDKAHDQIMAALHTDKDCAKYQSLRAWIYLKKDELKKAERILRSFDKQQAKKHIGSIQANGWLHYQKKQFYIAEQWFSRQHEWADSLVNDTYFWDSFSIADQSYILSILSDSFYGLALIKISQKDLATAIKMFTEALQQKNDFSGHREIKLALADTLYLQKKFSKAAHYYQEALSDQYDEKTHAALGWCLQKSGHSIGAETIFREGLKRSEDKRAFLYGLIVAEFYQGKTDKASEHFLELIAEDPYFADGKEIQTILQQINSLDFLVKKLAEAYFKRGDYKRARQNISFYISHNPNDWQAELINAWCDVYLGNHSLSLQKFSILLHNSDCPSDQVTTGMGVTLLYQKRFNDAKSAFIQALRINPKNKRAKVALGAVAYLDNNFQEAISIYSKHLSLLPQQENIFSWGSHALNNLGWSYIKTKQYDQALIIFNKLKLYHPKPIYPQAFLGLGWSYYYLGQDNKALNFFKHALSLDHNNKSANSGLTRLSTGYTKQDKDSNHI